MATPYLLVSNPPHGDVDAQLVAPEFECTAAEARMRVNFPAPEIWFADTDVDALKKIGASFMKGNAKVRIVKGSMLSVVPTADRMLSFRFQEDHLAMELQDAGAYTAPYDAKLVIVSARPEASPTLGMERPKPQLGHMSSKDLRDKFGVGGIIADEAGGDAEVEVTGIKEAFDPWFLDLYFIVQSKVQRMRAWTGRVDYSGLGSDLKPAAHHNHTEFLNRLKAQFTNAVFDERLVDVPAPKPSMISGKGLKTVLKSIDPALETVGFGDLQSRLVFLSRL
jgi:hypothetical protein